MLRSLATTFCVLLATNTPNAFGEGGGHRGDRGGFGGRGMGHEDGRQEQKGEVLLCAQQLGITMPTQGAGTQLTSDQRQQLAACTKNQRQDNRQALQAENQANLQACATQLGISLPTPGSQSTGTDTSSTRLTWKQREQLRQCMRQDQKTERQGFQQAVQACLTAAGITPGPGQPITQAQRQQIDVCVAQAANQQAGGAATNTAVSSNTDTSVATSTDTSTGVGTLTSTDTTVSVSTSVSTLTP